MIRARRPWPEIDAADVPGEEDPAWLGIEAALERLSEAATDVQWRLVHPGRTSPTDDEATATYQALALLLLRAAALEDLAARDSVIQSAKRQVPYASPQVVIDLANQPFDEAIQALQGRLELPGVAVLDVVGSYERATAQLAREVEATVRREVIDVVARGLSEGVSERDLAAMQSEVAEGISERVTRRTYRTLRTSANSAGRVAQAMHPDLAGFVVAMRYRAVGDARTRPNHVANDGLMWGVRSPVWLTRLPPNGYLCRCRVVHVTRPEAERLGRMDGDLFVDDPAPFEGEPDPGFARSSVVTFYGL